MASKDEQETIVLDSGFAPGARGATTAAAAAATTTVAATGATAETHVVVGGGEFIFRKHRGRKSKLELEALAKRNGGVLPPNLQSQKQSSHQQRQQQQQQQQQPQQSQTSEQLEATEAGFEVDRAAIYNSLLPKEILDEDKWRWTPLCRLIMNISDATRAISERLAEHRLSADEQEDIENKLRAISEDAKRVADSAEWMQMQLVSSVTASVTNPETFGHGPLVQILAPTSNSATAVPSVASDRQTALEKEPANDDIAMLRGAPPSANKFKPFRVPEDGDTPFTSIQ